ncbi:MAG: hypothetical protein AAGJ35_01725, partial [Myxococcota bacterium]
MTTSQSTLTALPREPIPAIDPLRSDMLLSLLLKVFRKGWLLALFYGMLSLGGCFLLAWWEGVLWTRPSSKAYVALLADRGNLINFGFVLPAGIIFILRFYRLFARGIKTLLEQNILTFPNHEARQQFCREVEHQFGRTSYFVFAFVLSFGLNIWIVLNLHGAWNS